jgi:hypothetical protein
MLVRLQITQLQGLSALSQIVQAHVSGLCCNSCASRAMIVATCSPQVPHAKLAAGLGVAICTFGECVITTSSSDDDSGLDAPENEESRTAFMIGCSTIAGSSAGTCMYSEGGDRYEYGPIVRDGCFAFSCWRRASLNLNALSQYVHSNMGGCLACLCCSRASFEPNSRLQELQWKSCIVF